jgi:DNA-binding NtrC family response regulator
MIRVLLVDDDLNLSEALKEGLTDRGFDVMNSYSGNDAIGIIGAGEFDVVVTDLYMSNGGGQQLIDWCRKNKPELKLLAVSGELLDSFVTALDVVEDNGIPTMEKPFTASQLGDVINGMMNNNFY